MNINTQKLSFYDSEDDSKTVREFDEVLDRESDESNESKSNESLRDNFQSSNRKFFSQISMMDTRT